MGKVYAWSWGNGPTCFKATPFNDKQYGSQEAIFRHCKEEHQKDVADIAAQIPKVCHVWPTCAFYPKRNVVQQVPPAIGLSSAKARPAKARGAPYRWHNRTLRSVAITAKPVVSGERTPDVKRYCADKLRECRYFSNGKWHVVQLKEPVLVLNRLRLDLAVTAPSSPKACAKSEALADMPKVHESDAYYEGNSYDGPKKRLLEEDITSSNSSSEPALKLCLSHTTPQCQTVEAAEKCSGLCSNAMASITSDLEDISDAPLEDYEGCYTYRKKTTAKRLKTKQDEQSAAVTTEATWSEQWEDISDSPLDDSGSDKSPERGTKSTAIKTENCHASTAESMPKASSSKLKRRKLSIRKDQIQKKKNKLNRRQRRRRRESEMQTNIQRSKTCLAKNCKRNNARRLTSVHRVISGIALVTSHQVMCESTSESSTCTNICSSAILQSQSIGTLNLRGSAIDAYNKNVSVASSSDSDVDSDDCSKKNSQVVCKKVRAETLSEPQVQASSTQPTVEHAGAKAEDTEVSDIDRRPSTFTDEGSDAKSHGLAPKREPNEKSRQTVPEDAKRSLFATACFELDLVAGLSALDVCNDRRAIEWLRDVTDACSNKREFMENLVQAVHKAVLHERACYHSAVRTLHKLSLIPWSTDPPVIPCIRQMITDAVACKEFF